MIHYLTNPAPFFNTDDEEKIYTPCEKGLYRSLELVGLAGFPYKLIAEGERFSEISSHAYEEGVRLFVPNGLLTRGRAPLAPPTFQREALQQELKALVGTPYVWGGNWHRGFPSLPVQFAGVDCSGLLYQVTKGTTPRNTSGLMTFGQEVSEESLEPLDIVVYRGHVVIVLDREHTIESHHGWGGVTIKPLHERLAQLKDEGKEYTCRRWLHLSSS